jgi:hypothetical protein
MGKLTLLYMTVRKICCREQGTLELFLGWEGGLIDDCGFN